MAEGDGTTLVADIVELLREIAGTDSIDQLRADVQLWKNSADLNEEWITTLRLRAAELLARGVLERVAPMTAEQRAALANVIAGHDMENAAGGGMYTEYADIDLLRPLAEGETG